MTLPASRRPLPPWARLHPDRAVLWRSADTVQVGCDPETAVLLDGLSPALAGLVRDLDGSRRPVELVAEAVARGGDRDAAEELLAQLGDAGMLHGPAPADPRLAADAAVLADAAGACGTGAPAVGGSVGGSAGILTDGDVVLAARAQAYVAVAGAGRVGVAIAGLLAAAGVGRVHVQADGLVTGADTGTGLGPDDVGRPRAEAAADAAVRAGPGVRTGPVARRRPDLVVLADAEVADLALARRLVLARRPHLLVRVREGVGVVGPLVLPGRSACLRCVELARAEADPDWPRLAAQLATRVAPAPLAVATATAAITVEQVLLLLDALPAATLAHPLLGVAVELDPRRARLRPRPVPVHPRCSCRPAGGPASPGAVPAGSTPPAVAWARPA